MYIKLKLIENVRLASLLLIDWLKTTKERERERERKREENNKIVTKKWWKNLRGRRRFPTGCRWGRSGLGSGYNRPPGDFVWFVGEAPLGSAGGSDRGHQNIGPKRKNTSPQIRWMGGGKTTTEGAARCQHSFSHYFISSIPLPIGLWERQLSSGSRYYN